MNKKEKILLWLSTFGFVYNKKIEQLLSLFKDEEDLYDNFSREKDEICRIVGSEFNYNKMMYSHCDDYIESTIKELEKDNIEVVTRVSSNYPKKLLEIDNPPYVLFCKGNVNLLETDMGIGVVGTRMPTVYGRSITESFCKVLAQNKFIVISGMASGIDTISHTTALDNGFPTIAVLGGGFNHIYPASNLNLSKRIIENGLLVSEYMPSFSAKNYTFIERNRIVAGLSKCILIPEAGEKSGALHTKNFAVDAGRDVFAIPGPITNPMSAGTNGIIKRGHGQCVTCPEDIFKYYEIEQNPIKYEKMPQLSIDESLIYSVLLDGEIDFDTLQEKTNLDTKMLNSCLTSLQISGIIKKLPGNKYSL